MIDELLKLISAKNLNAQQKMRKTSKSKTISKPKTTQKKLKEKEVDHHQVYFGTESNFLQSLVFCYILENNFSLFEQIEMRRVCRLWHYNVKHIWAKTHSLVLTLKNNTDKPKLTTDSRCKPNLKFESQQHSLTMANRVELTIGENHWNIPTLDLLGDLFRNIEHLTIYHEMFNMYGCIEVMSYFLAKFTKVKSFSLIAPPSGTTKEDFLSRIFKMINDHLAPLHTLHLDLPQLYHDTNHHSFPALKKENFHKTLPFLQNFSLNCTVENLGEMLQTVGNSLPTRWPIQSLSINIGHDQSFSQISTLFEQNPNLSQIKRLELTGLNGSSLNMVNRLLDHFTQLECLRLCVCLFTYPKIDFTLKWIQALRKLPRLKELFLWNFEIQQLNNLTHSTLDRSLTNIRKLTVISKYSFPVSLTVQYFDINGYDVRTYTQVKPKSFYAPYLHSFASQFPRLEQLTLKLTLDTFEQNFSKWCFNEFHKLKSLRLIDRYKDLSFTS